MGCDPPDGEPRSSGVAVASPCAVTRQPVPLAAAVTQIVLTRSPPLESSLACHMTDSCPPSPVLAGWSTVAPAATLATFVSLRRGGAAVL